MTIAERLDDPRCGCGALGAEDGLVTIDEALARIAIVAGAVTGTKVLPLAGASGRVLALPVNARANVPPFDNSAMDGYAVATSEMGGAGPWRLRVSGRVAAGQTGADAPPAGTATRIFTGAPLPPGTDAVVMQEAVRRNGDEIEIAVPVVPGSNIRRAGEDIVHGAEILAAGRRLGPREIAACAAAGQAWVTVRRPVRVALLITGDEVRPVGTGLVGGAIWDVNTPMLCAALSREAVYLVDVQSAADDPDRLRAQLADLAGRADLLVTTGGVSVGEEDHVIPALSALGGDISFSGVALKPGKPVSFGRLGGAYWLGLPGNPLSAYVTWQLFGTALLRLLAGQTGGGVARRHVVLGRDLNHRPGRCELRPARIAGFDELGREVVHCDAATHSARVGHLPEMGGVLFLPSEAEHLPRGALVEFLPFCDI